VITGFQGIGPDKRVTTLGRGGSDTSAVAVAAALNAACDIYTDVDGVYTADPRVVTAAHKLDRISYEEMLEQASLGAKVLQTRSVELAMVYKVPLQVRSSFEPPDSPNQNRPDGTGPGTIVCQEDTSMEQHVLSGIAYSRDEAKVSLRKVKDKPGVSAAIFGPLAEADISVDMIVQNISADGAVADLTFTLPRKDLRKAIELLTKLKEQIGYQEMSHSADVAKVSIIGIGMRSHAGVAARMFRSLADKGINIQAITTSEIKISVLIDEAYTELAVRALHTAYGLDKA
jgi:aspartate kinase